MRGEKRSSYPNISSNLLTMPVLVGIIKQNCWLKSGLSTDMESLMSLDSPATDSTLITSKLVDAFIQQELPMLCFLVLGFTRMVPLSVIQQQTSATSNQKDPTNKLLVPSIMFLFLPQ